MYHHIKNIFIILLFLAFTPRILRTILRNYNSVIEPRAHIGIISITNAIHSSSPYIEQLYAFFSDESIKGILLVIDSPGSTAGAGNSLYDEIKTLKKEYPKPIITLVENLCTSGAYWIACATDHIVTPGSGVLGNIGTQFNSIHIHKLLEKYDIEYTTISSGKYKTVGNPFTPLTTEQKEHIQHIQDDIYKQFVEVVAKERKLSLLQVNTWADGKLFTGRQAVQLGLADSNGSLQHATHVLKEKAFIDGSIEWVRPLQPFNVLKTLFGKQYNSVNANIVSYIITSLLQQIM